ncbi:ATP synthase subunit I [Paremcibacter congregatus]|uniref:N-ATPase subunit AtpR n=1 Tax=Paremcibacter congregatus TaxID=2043170 RepID=UPI003A9436BA|tara:strand:+ start:1246 stop:1512 length:267 start_codon:yes stop_codon:yes gene_type:complete
MLSHIVLCIVAGIGLGASFYLALGLQDLLPLRRISDWIGLFLHLMRFGITIWVFWIVAGIGSFPLLGVLAGFLSGRFLAMRLLRKKTL